MEPSHYEPVPKNIADQIIAGRTKLIVEKRIKILPG